MKDNKGFIMTVFDKMLLDFKNAMYPYSVKNIERKWTSRINILHISDSHIGSDAALQNLEESVNVGNELYSDGVLGLVVNSGDMTDGYDLPKANYFEQLSKLTNTILKSEASYILQMGNHDSNNGPDSVERVPTNEELWKNLFGKVKEKYPAIVWGDEKYSRYCYIDVNQGDHTVRVIALDMIDHPDYIGEFINYKCHWNAIYSQAQIDWLCKKALNVPDGYGVVVVNHFPFAPMRPYSYEHPALCDANFVQSNTGNIKDGWRMIPDIIKAWSERTCIKKTYYDLHGRQNINVHHDFSGIGDHAQFICFLCGHMHHKTNYVVQDENNDSYGQLMLLEDSSAQNEGLLTKTYKFIGLENDNAFSVISIDMDERKIYRTSYGCYKNCSDVNSKQVMVFDY